MFDENIFSALEKYSGENYLTAAFVFVINALLQQERPIGLEILTRLCVNNNEFSFDTDEAISISTQETIEQGILDIKISSPNKQIYIEVKDHSPVDPEQLKRYKEDLKSSSATVKRLILLTRFGVDFNEHQGIPDKHVDWRQVHKWLADAKTTAKHPVSIYFIDSFKSFLEVKQMSIQKVGWEYINGIPALTNLMNMIETAIRSTLLRINPRPQARHSLGFYFENVEFWCGIYYDNHLDVIFEIQDKKKFDTKLVVEPSYSLEEIEGMLGFHLHLENRHFFSLDKDEQLEEITKFVRTAYAEAQKMRVK